MSEFFDEAKRLVGFTPEKIARLHALHPVLEPHFRAIADLFYESLLSSPDALRVFRDQAQIERLKVTLVDWMSTGLRGPHDERFYEKRSRIGRRHVSIGLAQHYMFIAMNIVRTRYGELIANHYAPSEACGVASAAHCLLDLELMLMLRHYQLDSEERLIARERAAQAERVAALQTLSAGLAHEVRNPLNAAALQLELLSRRIARAGGDDKLVEPTRLVHHELQRLSGLLNEFISFARPPQLELGDHDLVSLVHHVIEVERAFAAERNVGIEFDTKAHAAVVQVDGGKVHQMVQNILRNAIEASPPQRTVTLTLSTEETGYTLSITDHGAGISGEVKARIFEPFFSTKEGGTGMGMAIVHAMVTLHHAELQLDSKPGHTQFTVHFARRLS